MKKKIVKGGGVSSSPNTKKLFKPLIASSLALALGVSVASATPTLTNGTTPITLPSDFRLDTDNGYDVFKNGGNTLENLMIWGGGNNLSFTNSNNNGDPELQLNSNATLTSTNGFKMNNGSGTLMISSWTGAPRVFNLELGSITESNNYAINGNLSLEGSDNGTINAKLGGKGVSGTLTLKSGNNNLTFNGSAKVEGNTTIQGGTNTFGLTSTTVFGGTLTVSGGYTTILTNTNQANGVQITDLLSTSTNTLSGGTLAFSFTDDATSNNKIFNLDTSKVGANKSLVISGGTLSFVGAKKVYLNSNAMVNQGNGTLALTGGSVEFVIDSTITQANNANDAFAKGNLQLNGGNAIFRVKDTTNVVGSNPFTNPDATPPTDVYYLDGNINIENGGISAFWDNSKGFYAKVSTTNNHSLNTGGGLIGKNDVWFAQGTFGANTPVITIQAINGGTSHIVFEDAVTISGKAEGDNNIAIKSLSNNSAMVLFKRGANINGQISVDHSSTNKLIFENNGVISDKIHSTRSGKNIIIFKQSGSIERNMEIITDGGETEGKNVVISEKTLTLGNSQAITLQAGTTYFGGGKNILDIKGDVVFKNDVNIIAKGDSVYETGDIANILRFGGNTTFESGKKISSITSTGTWQNFNSRVTTANILSFENSNVYNFYVETINDADITDLSGYNYIGRRITSGEGENIALNSSLFSNNGGWDTEEHQANIILNVGTIYIGGGINYINTKGLQANTIKAVKKTRRGTNNIVVGNAGGFIAEVSANEGDNNILINGRGSIQNINASIGNNVIQINGGGEVNRIFAEKSGVNRITFGNGNVLIDGEILSYTDGGYNATNVILANSLTFGNTSIKSDTSTRTYGNAKNILEISGKTTLQGELTINATRTGLYDQGDQHQNIIKFGGKIEGDGKIANLYANNGVGQTCVAYNVLSFENADGSQVTIDNIESWANSLNAFGINYIGKGLTQGSESNLELNSQIFNDNTWQGNNYQANIHLVVTDTLKANKGINYINVQSLDINNIETDAGTNSIIIGGTNSSNTISGQINAHSNNWGHLGNGSNTIKVVSGDLLIGQGIIAQGYDHQNSNNITLESGNLTINGGKNEAIKTHNSGGNTNNSNNITVNGNIVINGDIFATSGSNNISFTKKGVVAGNINGAGQNNFTLTADDATLTLKGANSNITTLTAFNNATKGNTLILDASINDSVDATINTIANGDDLKVNFAGINDASSTKLTLNTGTNQALKSVSVASGANNTLALTGTNTMTIESAEIGGATGDQKGVIFDLSSGSNLSFTDGLTTNAKGVVSFNLGGTSNTITGAIANSGENNFNFVDNANLIFADTLTTNANAVTNFNLAETNTISGTLTNNGTNNFNLASGATTNLQYGTDGLVFSSGENNINFKTGTSTLNWKNSDGSMLKSISTTGGTTNINLIDGTQATITTTSLINTTGGTTNINFGSGASLAVDNVNALTDSVANTSGAIALNFKKGSGTFTGVINTTGGTTTINVGDSANTASGSISGAINTTSGGSTEVVYGSATGNKSLTLQGANNDLTLIDATNAGSLIFGTTQGEVIAISKAIKGSGLNITFNGVDAKTNKLTLNNENNGSATNGTVSTIDSLTLKANSSDGANVYNTLELTAGSTAITTALDIVADQGINFDFNGATTALALTLTNSAGVANLNFKQGSGTFTGAISTTGTGVTTINVGDSSHGATGAIAGSINTTSGLANVVFADVNEAKKLSLSGTNNTISSINLGANSVNSGNILNTLELAGGDTKITTLLAIDNASKGINFDFNTESTAQLGFGSNGTDTLTNSAGVLTLNFKQGDGAFTSAISTTGTGVTTINVGNDTVRSTEPVKITQGIIDGTINTTGGATNVAFKGNNAVLILKGDATLTSVSNSIVPQSRAGDASTPSTPEIRYGSNNEISLYYEGRDVTKGFKTLEIGTREADGTSSGNGISGDGLNFLVFAKSNKEETPNTQPSGRAGGVVAPKEVYSDKIIIRSSSNTEVSNHKLGVIFKDGTFFSEISYDKTKDNNILVATVANDSKVNLSKSETTILGFNIADVNYVTESADENGAITENGNYTNYYVGSIKNVNVIGAEQEITATAFSFNYDLYMANLNSLNKRMGELRDNPHSQGVWARVFNGAQTNKQGLETKSNYTTIQAGYDYAFGFEGANNYLGFALSYALSVSTSDKAFDTQGNTVGFGDIYSNAVEVAVYNSYVMDSGWYNDTIAKFSYLMSNFSINDTITQQSASNDTQNFAFTLGDEVGYVFKLGESKEWSITPQVELTFGYFNQSDLKRTLERSGSYLNSVADAVLTLRARTGSSFSYDFKNFTQDKGFNASLYVGAFYEYDYVNGGDISMTTEQQITHNNQFNDIGSDGRVVVNVGTNMSIQDNTRLYFDFEKSFVGDLTTDYQVNFGVRYSFGESNGYTPVVENTEFKAPLKVEDKESAEKEAEVKDNKTQETSNSSKAENTDKKSDSAKEQPKEKAE